MVLVARQGAQLLGMVNLLYTVSTALGEQVALLEDMVVCAERAGRAWARNCCSGTQDRDGEWLSAHNPLTDESNHAAQRFYRRQGFEASSMLPHAPASSLRPTASRGACEVISRGLCVTGRRVENGGAAAGGALT